jgi:hypothetical protein
MATTVEIIMEAPETIHVPADRRRNAPTADERDTTSQRTASSYQPMKRSAKQDGNLCLRV